MALPGKVTGPDRSVRWRVQSLVLACVLPAWLLALALSWWTYQRERDNRVDATVKMARALVQQVDSELLHAIGVLQTLATSSRIDAQDYAAFHARAGQSLRYAGGDNIVLFDTTLQGLVSVAHPYGTPLPRTRHDRFPTVLASGQPAVSEVFVGQVSQKTQVAVAVPVLREGRAVARLEMVFTPQRFAQILEKQGFAPSWTAAILDASGHIVARSRDAERFVGKPAAEPLREQLRGRAEGHFPGRTSDGIHTIGCYSRSAAFGWTVAIGLPLGELRAELARTLGLVLAGGAALLAAGLVLAHRLACRIGEPVQALVAPALAIGRGEAAAVAAAPTRTGLREASEVGAALQQAAALLQQRDHARQQAEAALRESQTRLRMALDACQIGDWDLDLRSQVLQHSPRHDQCFGYSQPVAHWSVETFFQRLHPDDRDRVRRFMDGVFATRQPTWQMDCRVVWPDGSVHWLATQGMFVFEHDEPVRILGIVIDITERKQAEELRLQGVRLEAENRQILEASRLKSEFLANMSHELRTPLNAVIGFADILRSPMLPPDSPKRDEYLGHIAAAGRHLLQLINDVLDLAKVESGKLSFFPEPVDLPRLVQEVLGVLQAEAAHKRIAIGVELDPALVDLVLDPSRLKQVLYNFLSNAIKFTEPGGWVQVRARVEGPARWRLEVQDCGIGIAEADQARLFTPFLQVSAGLTKQHGGTGLGLALTRRLVELQGGQVGVKSQPGQGSVFHAELPRHSGVGTATEPAAAVADAAWPATTVAAPVTPAAQEDR